MRAQRHSRPRILLTVLIATVVLCVLFSTPLEVDSTKQKTLPIEAYISPMGQYARGDLPIPDVSALLSKRVLGPTPVVTSLQGDDQLVHSPTKIDFQSETAIAVNGNNIVVAYNDILGFGLTPPSVVGYAYSSNGGMTWTDGGNLPTAGADGVFGDPDVKTWSDETGGDYFFISSIYETPGGQSSLCVHVSSDGGASWSAPREVTSATTNDFADKEFMDVDAETGRIIMAWSNITGSGPDVTVGYSDDLGLTWSNPVSLGPGMGAIPRADGSKGWAYVAWRTLFTGEIKIARSSNNGTSWQTPTTVVSGLTDPMNPYGSDRNPNFISMDVDDASGNVYIVYPDRQLAPDFSDIYFTSSTNNAGSFSSPQAINASPGDDRSQFFPWVCVDENSADVSVIWYDQILAPDGIFSTEDLTDVFHTHSADQGGTWSCPTPLTDRSFHAEAGNWASQPNIGDYIQAVQVSGTLYSAFAKTDRPAPFTFAPDSYVDISTPSPVSDISVHLQSVAAIDTGCINNNTFWEPGETIQMILRLEDRTACQPLITGISGTLTSTSPYVTIANASQPYGQLVGQLSTTTNTNPYLVMIDQATPCGEAIDFELVVSSDVGEANLQFTRRIGKPVATTLLEENFDLSASLPPGWSNTHWSGTVNPWVTSSVYSLSPPYAAFCADIATASFNELVSPTLFIPSATDLLRIQCSVTHNLEIDVERRAWDGAVMQVDINGTRRMAGAVGEMDPFYPWQMNRAPNRPLADYACWSDNITPDFVDVVWDIPDLANQVVGLLFGLSTDVTNGTPSGIFVDDVKMEKIVYHCDCGNESALGVASDPVVSFVGVPLGVTTCDTVCIVNSGTADLEISDVSGCTTDPFSLDLSMMDFTVAPGDTTKFLVCVNPGAAATTDTCQINILSNDPNGTTLIPVNLFIEVGTGIGGDTPPLPFRILSVAPNPFNPETLIRFELPSQMPVTAEVWSVSGKRIRVLTRDKQFGPGLQEIRWRGLNDQGQTVASGVYFIRLSTPVGERHVRAVLLK